jgi:RNA polymerase sigma-B factor
MHRNLVTYLARRFMDRGELFDDIVQQGLIGLIQAMDHFDPNRGVRFATFATPTIVGEIRRYFRDKTWGLRVPRRMQELNQAISHKVELLTQEMNRSPTYVEIARALNIEVEDVAEALEASHALEPMSLDDRLPTDKEAGSIVDHVGAPDPILESCDDHAALQTALNRLPEKQRAVLQYAYFDGLSQAEIARTMKVSQMHISRLLRRALQQLRRHMEEE